MFEIAYVLRMPQWYLLKELDRILWGGGHGGTRKPKPLGGLLVVVVPSCVFISYLRYACNLCDEIYDMMSIQAPPSPFSGK